MGFQGGFDNRIQASGKRSSGQHVNFQGVSQVVKGLGQHRGTQDSLAGAGCRFAHDNTHLQTVRYAKHNSIKQIG